MQSRLVGQAFAILEDGIDVEVIQTQVSSINSEATVFAVSHSDRFYQR